MDVSAAQDGSAFINLNRVVAFRQNNRGQCVVDVGNNRLDHLPISLEEFKQRVTAVLAG